MKQIYIIMAALAGLVFAVGDAYFKMKVQNHADIGFFDFLRFWTLPTGVVLGLIVAYGFGVFGKFLSIYPLKEVDISIYAPMVVVFATLACVGVGILVLKEQLTYIRTIGIFLAFGAVYFLNRGG